ncbi:rRNA maturation RNase YbeY [Mediterraneibacter catenae]|uniref:Endoribonuclease YbeY n=1 Tax=Mediterraneibacter catenae TaxID=2594882 RepID=A0A5M9I030_9FIRM|nr:rRNA maturation RNase YbeY [Mediterraneibacter catenae]KAA8502544.1 rRNA maturation RNase YbeY [Mediterraneibacter catenae]
MSLFIETEGKEEFDFDIREIAELVVNAVLEHEKCPYETEISLLLTHNDEIHEMNLEHRGIDRATDVLSFPMLDFDHPGDFSIIDEETADVFDPESGELMLGDIVISVDKVLEQAQEYGHSPKREYAFLIAHSMLHLCGYDHMDDEERKVMEEKQRAIMEKINILR